ncbi:NADP-dependent oxidoreductase [Streptococcus loxodontisalivarius]|uniref:NADPH:quinone reductase-like Zn-dependent oxidoreductase n=1 Tax=Streptococcus loxodontisalivarius TaxID=1349415 RepID=A0ABS2PRR2_9STRE|nr:NADP-dependent oxidoreductase [Streptococcus loxodontisalivarius]MBM7642680.1 NADPH:quinone reductase-like Zn-dependent oxidoreductase [Streptococcus loxodontisalivarius]
MKKILLNQYGSVDVMQMTETNIPSLKPQEVLIKTVAIGVNDPDIIIREYGPFPTMPKEIKPTLPHSLGQDFSGIVEAVGSKVKNVRVGDHVIGMSFMNTYSDYIVLDEEKTLALAKVPKELDLLPLGGFLVSIATAYAATVRDGQVKAGHRVLIHGGSGGVGNQAIQLAKNAGAYVIATGSGQGLDDMLALGADQVIDYRKEDFTQILSNLDLVVNLTGQETLDKSYDLVKPGGIITSVNGAINQELTEKLGITGIYSMGFISPAELENVISLYQEGKLRLLIDKTYPFDLDHIKQAHLDFQAGGNKGKKIITFN